MRPLQTNMVLTVLRQQREDEVEDRPNAHIPQGKRPLLLPKKASNKSRLAYRARPHGSLGYVVAMQELLH